MNNMLHYCFSEKSRVLTSQRKRAFEIIEGKEENAGNQHFLLFPQCFLSCQRTRCSSVWLFLVAVVEYNATLGSILYFENHIRNFVQNRRKQILLTSIFVWQINLCSIALKCIMNCFDSIQWISMNCFDSIQNMINSGVFKKTGLVHRS